MGHFIHNSRQLSSYDGKNKRKYVRYTETNS